jgi:Ca-activated chloride channel family protein
MATTKGDLMTWLSPWWFGILILIPLYLVTAQKYHWSIVTSQKWLVASIVLLVIALARPALPQHPVDVQQLGHDVILAVDLSYSMRGTDVAPNRLEEAKKVLLQTIKSHPNDRFGVIGFTTQAIILSPLTHDVSLLESLFNALDETQIMTKGTSIMSALELSRKMSHAPSPLVILLTDGGDENNYDKEGTFAQEKHLKVDVFLLGTKEGSMLPTDEGSLKDENGNLVISARNDAIATLADHSGGEVVTTSGTLQSLIDHEHRDTLNGLSRIQTYQELFYVPLAFSLIAFMLAMTTLGEKFSRGWVILLAFIGLSAQGGVLDFGYNYWATHQYQHHNYEDAAHLFGRINSPYAQYNHANSLYKAGKYDQALALYRTIRSRDPFFKSLIYYNMGNCHIRLQSFEEARNAFLASLTLNYTPQADANLRFIAHAQEKKTLNTRKEKKDTFDHEENAPTGEKKVAKEGGGSNLKSDMKSGGGGDGGKKVEGDPRFSASQGKAQLSSTQYELINARSVHETNPW